MNMRIDENVGRPQSAATQQIAYTGAAAPTTALTDERVFRVVTSTDAFIRIGASAVAVATTDMFVPAYTPEYFFVPKGYVISAIRSSTSGTMYATPME